MYNYSAMEAKIKALESEIEYLKRIAQINEEHFKIQAALFDEQINALNSSDSVTIDHDKINEAAEGIYQSITDGELPSQLEEHWNKYQDKYGDIMIASEADDLICAIIRYTLEMSKNYDY